MPQNQVPTPPPHPTLLRRLWIMSLGAGAAAFGLGLAWAASDPGLDWVWAAAAFGLGAVIYNLAFFALCSAFAPGLAEHVEDDTEVSGGDVVHVTRHGETGDPRLDAWIKPYATARGVSAVAIVSLVTTGVVLLFF